MLVDCCPQTVPVPNQVLEFDYRSSQVNNTLDALDYKNKDKEDSMLTLIHPHSTQMDTNQSCRRRNHCPEAYWDDVDQQTQDVVLDIRNDVLVHHNKMPVVLIENRPHH